MKKKGETSGDGAIISSLDLKSLIGENAVFFDNLIELIPAKFYLPSDEPKPWFQGLSKAAKASAKQQNKEHKKILRRERLDPEKSQTTTLDLLKQSIGNKREREKMESDNEEEEGDGEGEGIKAIRNLEGDDKSVTYEELRQRLHRRLDEMRGNRFGNEESKASRKEKRDMHMMKKRKRMSEKGEKKEKVIISKAETERQVEEAANGIQFGKVKLVGNDEAEARNNKRRKLSKEKELEKAMSLAEEKKDPEKGRKHSWTAALSRASGAKVHDDPKLLKQRMQKEKKRQEKNAEKWKERVESRDKMKKERQKKRSDNISGKIHEKKMKKIAKREKKLMRPGFEGRKEGYITTQN